MGVVRRKKGRIGAVAATAGELQGRVNPLEVAGAWLY